MKDKLNILVADDNKHFINAFQYLLFDGFGEKIEKLLTAVSGKEALQILRSTSVDLVFMDIEMPGQNGVEIAKKITDTYSGVEVVALSFNDDKMYVQRMMDAGASCYVNKEEISKSGLQDIFNRLV